MTESQSTRREGDIKGVCEGGLLCIFLLYCTKETRPVPCLLFMRTIVLITSCIAWDLAEGLLCL